jgi:hypothetical protein
MTTPPHGPDDTPDMTEPLGDPLSELWAAFVRWVCFGITLAVLPIATNWISSLTRGGEVSAWNILGNGELLLVSAVLGATSVGELMGARTRRFIIFRSVLSGFNLPLILLASIWFADISATVRSDVDVDQRFVAIGSLVVFLTEVTISGCSFLVTRLEDKR